MTKLKNKFIKATYFSRGKAFVKIDNSENNFCINKKGEILFSTKCRPPYGYFDLSFDFPFKFNLYNQCVVMYNSLYGVMNSNGELIVPCEWDDIFEYRNYYKLQKANLTVYKDLSGNTVFNPKSINQNKIVSLKQDVAAPSNVINFEQNGKYGIMNIATGKILIPFEYDYCGNFFGSDLALVEKNDRYGFVNSKNEIIIPLEYEFAEDMFKEGLCLVGKEGKYGFIDEENNVVIPLKYGIESCEFIEGIACVEVEDRINSSYKYILPDGENAF